MTSFEIYSILKDVASYLSTYVSKKKKIEEINFGLLIQAHLNKEKVSNSFLIEFRSAFLEKYRFYDALDHFYNVAHKKINEFYEKEFRKTSDGKESITILAIIKSSKDKISKDKLERIKRNLEEIKPQLVFLEEVIQGLPSTQGLDDIKNLLSIVNFSSDDDLNRKFRRSFFLFIEAFEKTPIKIPYLNSYLFGIHSLDFSDLHTTIETITKKSLDEALKNPLEYIKKVRIITEGLTFSNITLPEKDLKKVEKHLIRLEKNKFIAKDLIKALYSYRYFIETNYCGIFLFLLAWNEKFMDKPYLEKTLKNLEVKLDELLQHSNMFHLQESTSNLKSLP